jgi:transposase
VAEQAIRFVVMDRRATQGTRSPKGRTFCERIWTVVGTCRIQKRSIFNYLWSAVAAWADNLPAPSLSPADSS